MLIVNLLSIDEYYIIYINVLNVSEKEIIEKVHGHKYKKKKIIF